MDELESKTNARRAQGGKGLLSRTIHIQELKNPWLKSLVLERRGRKRERREGRQREGEVACYSGKKRGREGEGGFNTNNSQPKRLNYP